jgi:hypothetical protein
MALEDDNANFLDSDEVVGVSDALHDWSLDQVMLLEQAIPAEDRVVVNWNCPDHLRTTKMIRQIAKLYETSFTRLVVQAMPHGYAIISHDYSSAIDTISNLDDAAVVNDTDEYFSHLIYKPVVGRDVRRMTTIADRITAEAMGNTAAIIGTSRSHLAGACVLASLCTSDLIPDTSRTIMLKHVSSFTKGIDLYLKLATSLT